LKGGAKRGKARSAKPQSPRLIGITGTPGTGKKTVAPLVAALLGLPPPIALNSLSTEPEIDPRVLRERLLRRLSAGTAAAAATTTIVVGHLFPDVVRAREAKMVALLRCDPSELRDRLARRGYPEEKIVSNVEAELIGVVLDSCARRFGDVLREYDTTSARPEEVARRIAGDARSLDSSGGSEQQPGGVAPPRHPIALWIDWTLDYGSSGRLRSLLAQDRAPPFDLNQDGLGKPREAHHRLADP
jgi:adenylate kinase